MNQPWWKRNVEFSQREKGLAQMAMRNTFLRFIKRKFPAWNWNLYILPDAGEMRLMLTSSLDRAASVRLLSAIYFFFLSEIDPGNVFRYKDVHFEYSLSKEVFRDMFGGCVRNLIDSRAHLSIFPRIWSRQTTVEEYHVWLRDVFDIDMTQQVVATMELATMELLWV